MRIYLYSFPVASPAFQTAENWTEQVRVVYHFNACMCLVCKESTSILNSIPNIE